MDGRFIRLVQQILESLLPILDYLFIILQRLEAPSILLFEHIIWSLNLSRFEERLVNVEHFRYFDIVEYYNSTPISDADLFYLLCEGFESEREWVYVWLTYPCQLRSIILWLGQLIKSKIVPYVGWIRRDNIFIDTNRFPV